MSKQAPFKNKTKQDTTGGWQRVAQAGHFSIGSKEFAARTNQPQEVWQKKKNLHKAMLFAVVDKRKKSQEGWSDSAPVWAWLREENQLLRRQLENHPEMHRLSLENASLRERLSQLERMIGRARNSPRLQESFLFSETDGDGVFVEV